MRDRKPIGLRSLVEAGDDLSICGQDATAFSGGRARNDQVVFVEWRPDDRASRAEARRI
jgi:hypothetical protein